MREPLAIFAGSSHPQLVDQICKNLGIPVSKSTLSKFSNRETNVKIDETVRDINVFIIQTSCGSVNDIFIELLIMISACKTASAKKVTAVIPCFPYARQSESHNSKELGKPSGTSRKPGPVHFVDDGVGASRTSTMSLKGSPKQSNLGVSTTSGNRTSLDENRSPLAKESVSPVHRTKEEIANNRKRLSSISTSQPNISISSLNPKPLVNEVAEKTSNGYKRWSARPGTLIANTLMAAGCDHVITMDLHDPQFQGFFDIPVDNLYSHPLIIKYIKEKIPDYRDAVIVSPDAGGAKRATLIADKLKMDFALVHKEKLHHGPRGGGPLLVGDVEGKFCIIIDDMSDTAETICSASQTLIDKGASKVYAIITHGILSGNSLDRINSSTLSQVIVSNTVPQEFHKSNCDKIRVMDVSIIFAEAIRRIHNGESVSFLADVVPY